MITKDYIYKKQGDGRDSWECTETDDNGNIINKYMVYEDPNQPQGAALKAILNATPEELEQIRNLLLNQ